MPGAALPPRTVRVGVAGLGFVGRETVRLLRENRQRFEDRLGAGVELVAVADRQAEKEAKALGLPASVKRFKDPEELVRSGGADIVVEVLGGLDAPRRVVLAALAAGRHVVTANKLLLSHCWDELHAAAAKSGGRLYFEGSVAGGIPVLQALDRAFAANRIEAVYGILNGTTNYILTRAEEGLDPKEALAEAQRLGFAEKDPTLDLSGGDAAQKVSVLAALLTGAGLPPEKIAREGIERIDAGDVAFAREQLLRTPKLIGAVKLSWGKRVRVEAHVFPTLVPLTHPLAAVRREYNAVLVRASSAADLMFYGKGAGPGPTASAVVGDVFMLARDLLGRLPAARPRALDVELAPIEESVASFYLRLFAQDKPGVLARVTAALARREISIASIHQPEKPERSGLMPIVLTTHPTTHGRFHAALGEILKHSSIAKRHTVLRLL